MATVLVTGANRGIGLEFARQYSNDGWQVIACCRRPAAADDLLALASGDPERIAIHPLDVTEAGAAEAVAAKLDGRPIDLLINNAGVIGPDRQSVTDMDYAGWQSAMETNVFGPLRVVQALARNVLASETRLIATVSSRMGSIGQNQSSDHVAYRTSKAAVNQVMCCVGNELGPKGVISVVFHPGWVRTAMGGANAAVAVPDSAAGMRRVIAGLTEADNGRFFDFEGTEIGW